MSEEKTALARRLGLFSLAVYGIGDMVGAGIYGTIGVAAGMLGNALWLSFLVAMGAALLTALSYASLGSRYPRAGGVAYILQRAFGRPVLSYVAGLAVAASGLTSMAAGANVFSRTLGGLFPGVPPTLILVAFLLLLTAINLVGIRESLTANLVCTAVEIGGLVFILAIGASSWGDVDYMETPADIDLSPMLLLSGAVLTFYAFVGFEDMLNVAEEVKNPAINMPRGILIALGVTGLLYIAIAITAVSVVPAAELADSSKGAPFAQITARAAPWLSPWVFNGITLFAVANTALLNYVMGSRLLYGMARQGLVPAGLGAVHPRFRTPHRAIFTLGGLVLVLAFAGDIAQLASATSLLLLTCFCLVNASLLVLQRRPDEPRGRLEIPAVIPALGALVCAGLLAARAFSPGADIRPVAIAALIIAALAGLYFLMHRGKSPGQNLPS